MCPGLQKSTKRVVGLLLRGGLPEGDDSFWGGKEKDELGRSPAPTGGGGWDGQLGRRPEGMEAL
jgi:hypothetical protein